jgi:DnaJ-class molecular chaperone
MEGDVLSQPGSLYWLLGVSADAPRETIIHAYRRRARTWHPDVRPDDPEAALRFRMLTDAYHVLTDPVQRADYDRQRRADAGGRLSPAAGGDSARGDRRHRVDAPSVGGSNAPDVFFDARSSRSRPALWAGPVRVERATKEASMLFRRTRGPADRDLEVLASLLFDGWFE